MNSKQAVKEELKIWQETNSAYKDRKELLKCFANKLYFELRHRIEEETIKKVLKEIDDWFLDGKMLLDYERKEELKERIEKI